MINLLVSIMLLEGAIFIMLFALWCTFHYSEKKEIPSEEGNDSCQDSNKDDLSLDTIIKARDMYEKQKDEKKMTGSGWDFWDERVQIENLLCKRFNYLILCYSMFVAAFSVIEDRISKFIILFVGLIILFIMSLFVNRAWRKLDYNLKILFVLQDGFNGMKLIDQEVAKKAGFLYKTLKKLNIKYNALIGVFIPCVLCFSFFIGIVLILVGWWKI